MTTLRFRPRRFKARTIARGESYSVRVQVTDADGAPVSLIVAGRSVVLRLRKVGDDTEQPVPPIGLTKTSGVAGEYSYQTDGSDGDVTLLVGDGENEGIDLGPYDEEGIFVDTAQTPDVRKILWTRRLTVIAASTGDIRP